MFFALLVPDPGAGRPAARDRVADTVAIVLALVYGLGMVMLGDATRPGAPLPWIADVVVGIACAAALTLRRRHSLAVTAALLPFGAVSITATGPIVVALFTAAIRHRLPVLALLGSLNVATSGIYFTLHDHPEFGIWVDLVVRGVVTGAALGWGLFVQAYRRLTTSLRDHAARLEAEQRLREDRAKLTERARIAREMHDVLAHRMSLISLHAGALEVRGTVSPEELTLAAGAIRGSAHEALEELRAVVGVPSGRPEPPQPGLADMDELVGSARAAGMAVDYTNELPADDPPEMLGRTVYRIVQEGLTNARKHGSGPAATVRLAGAAGHALTVTIINPLTGTPSARPPGDGQAESGAARPPGAGLGLVGIGERVALAGGRVTHGPADGAFHLDAELPWPA